MNNYSLEVNSIDCCFGLSRNIRGDYQIVKTYFMFNIQCIIISIIRNVDVYVMLI